MMDAIDFELLAGIGLGAAIQQQLANGVADPQARPMRLVEVQREHLLLHDGRVQHRALCSPVLAVDLQAQHESLVVGDWVLARPGGALGWLVACRLLPQHQITRRSSARHSDGRAGAQRQALVSNVDTALLVMGLDADFNLRRLERYLALAQLAGVAAVLVLSKADTLDAALCAQRLLQVRELLPAEVTALALDLRQPAAAAALARWLQRGQTLVLLGSSGAGKSTLANTLLTASSQPADPAEAAMPRPTGPVRSDDSRGRHTTTVRSLLPLPGGACVIDTPGLRALRLDVDNADDLALAFGDVARWSPLCRFRDCQHRLEPGCRVRELVPEPRLRNYHKLLREARRDSVSVDQRREQLALWKSRSRHAELRSRAKRESGG